MLGRRIRLWTLWLLPLLAVPGGFMLSVESGVLALTFCPGSTQSRSLADLTHHASAHDQHAHHGGAHQGKSDGAADDAPCPFALVGAAAVSCIPASATAIAACDVSLPIYVSHNSQFGPIRADCARGPPAFPADVAAHEWRLRMTDHRVSHAAESERSPMS